MTSVRDLIRNQPFKTIKHVLPQVRTRFRIAKRSRVAKLLSEIPHDRHLSEYKNLKPYMVKIFSVEPNTWFHDIFDNGRNTLVLQGHTPVGAPRYWHIFIGTNTRYAVALPLRDRSAQAINETLSRFLQQYHPVKLTSDKELGFRAEVNKQLCRNHRCRLQFIADKNHSTLGLVDRFIRTLRDMNMPTAHDRKQSTDPVYKVISEGLMERLMNNYNNAFHTSSGCTPHEMFTTPELEKEHVFKHLRLREGQQRMSDFKLKPGMYVRYRLPRDGFAKRRSQYSLEQYPIVSVKGNMYTLSASDGTRRLFPRFRLVMVTRDGSKNPNFKVAKTFA